MRGRCASTAVGLSRRIISAPFSLLSLGQGLRPCVALGCELEAISPQRLSYLVCGEDIAHALADSPARWYGAYGNVEAPPILPLTDAAEEKPGDCLRAHRRTGLFHGGLACQRGASLGSCVVAGRRREPE